MIATGLRGDEGDGPQPAARAPRWSEFDPVWYLGHYPDVAARMAAENIVDPRQFYDREGAALGHAPNMFFDETWYLRENPDVATAVQAGYFTSGFAHYSHDGFRARSPHWLFSERFYRASYPDVTRRLLDRHRQANGYDHYLTMGDRAFRSGHRFFDAGVFYDNRPEAASGTVGAFEQFLTGGHAVADLAPVSWYFDPQWYLRTYPEIQREIEIGLWRCALHHFLCNPTPGLFEPLESFREEFYTGTYPDVKQAIAAGHFRSGYDHFIQCGAPECRRPHPDIDLLRYFQSGRVQADIENGVFPDPFAHFLANRGRIEGDIVTEPASETQAKRLLIRHAEAMLPLYARSALDFTPMATPDFSVIMVVRDQFALTMMALASLRANFAGAIELILVDSGSKDETRHIENVVRGARLVRLAYNAGFVVGCNAALPHVTAPALLFLNNDLLLGPHACRQALTRLLADHDIGAVGGKIIRTNGVLQEAGSMIWRDGTTAGYLRDADPDTPEANFVREVDYCSGAFLMTRTEWVKDLGGFDEDYRPAYYEEADLCVRLRKSGYRIMYDPAIVIQHLEYGSGDSLSSVRLMQRNHKLFAAKHLEYLRYQHPAQPRNIVHARSPGQLPYHPAARDGRPLRILFIEDRIPLRRLGSGYVRSNDIIHCMAELGHTVSVFPIYRAFESLIEIFRNMPDSVEVFHDRGMERLASLIDGRAGYYDIVWIARTHNLERLLPILANHSAALPGHGFVLDTEAIAASRTAEQNRVLGRPAMETLEEAVRRELACAYFCQKIIAVNAADASLIRAAGHGNVSLLGHMNERHPTPSTWGQRRDLLLLGALHDSGSPNHDGMEWFVTEILPRLDPVLAPDIRVTIAGHVQRGVDLSRLGDHPRVDLIGPVDELAPLYDRHRVFIAPTRFAGGIPYKLHEAASYGLPAVATDLLCRQLGWTDNREIQAGGDDDPEGFARAILHLYHDEAAWNRIRTCALDRLRSDNDRSNYLATLREILGEVAPESAHQAGPRA